MARVWTIRDKNKEQLTRGCEKYGINAELSVCTFYYPNTQRSKLLAVIVNNQHPILKNEQEKI